MSTIVFDILARDRASDKFDHVGDSAAKSSGKLKKFAAVGAAAVATGAVVAGKALWDATQAAGDLGETMSKTNAIFGNRSGNVLAKWAESADKSFGMSKQTALDAASTFGTFGKAAGKSGKDLRTFAMEQTALAADLASFNNTSPEQAIEALGAAFRGEAEPLRSYGVLLDDASMRNEAMRMGLIKTTKEALTPQQKVLAAQALIMKQTSDAQGDFSRTSGSLGNQQKILKAEFANISTEVGAKLLPLATKLVTWINRDGIPAFRDAGKWVQQELLPPLQRFAKAVGPVLLDGLKLLGRVIKTVLPPALDALATAFEGVADAGKWMWEKVLRPTFSKVLQGFETLATAAANMLDAMSKAPGMGWAKDAADKLRNMAEKAGAADRAIRGIPSYKNVQVSINFLYPKGKPTKHIEDTDDWLNNLSRGRVAGGGRSGMSTARATSLFYDALADAAKRGGEKLDKVLESSRDRLRDKLSSLRDEMSSMADSIASALDRSDFGGTLEEHLASLTGTNSGLTNLMSVFQNLKAGASKDYLQKVMESGNLGLATALGNDPAALARASALSDANAAMAKSLGADTAQTILGDRITQALAAEIAKLIAELKDAPGKTAKKLREEIKELRLVVSGLEAGRIAHLRGAH